MIEIEEILSGEDNLKDFEKFLKEFGIEDTFEDELLSILRKS